MSDYSKEIFDKYFSADRSLKVTLKNGTVMKGRLVSFFHGDPDEPYIIKWHFVSEEDLAKYREMPFTGDEAPIGTIIKQEDIENVSLA